MADTLFWRDSSGRLTFSMHSSPGENYPAICQLIREAFGLTPRTCAVTECVNVVFHDYAIEGQVVGLEWDNWMGFMVVAKDAGSEALVQEIAAWLLQSKSVTSFPVR